MGGEGVQKSSFGNNLLPNNALQLILLGKNTGDCSNLVHVKEMFVLCEQGIIWLSENVHQGIFVQGAKTDRHRKSSNKLWDHAVGHEIT